MSFMARNIGSAGGRVSLAPAYTANFTAVSGPTTITGTLTFNNDGTISTSHGAGGAGPGAMHDWWTPSGGTPGTALYMKATATVGTFTTNGMSSFTLLSTAPSISVTGSLIKSCTFTLQVATDAAGTNIIATQTGNSINVDGS